MRLQHKHQGTSAVALRQVDSNHVECIVDGLDNLDWPDPHKPGDVVIWHLQDCHAQVDALDAFAPSYR